MPNESQSGIPGRESPRWVGLLILMVALLSVLDLVWPGVLGYDRAAIELGQWWRLLTAHYVHLNLIHAVMNIAALVLVFALLREAAAATTWWLVYTVVSLSVSAALYLAEPQLARYVGASGVIHGLIAFGALLRLTSHRIESVALLLGLLAKIIYESHTGAVGGSEALIGAPVITAAHRYGAITGTAVGMAVALARRFLARPSVT